MSRSTCEVPSPPYARKRQRYEEICRHWPDCNFKDACWFEHPPPQTYRLVVVLRDLKASDDKRHPVFKRMRITPRMLDTLAKAQPHLVAQGDAPPCSSKDQPSGRTGTAVPQSQLQGGKGEKSESQCSIRGAQPAAVASAACASASAEASSITSQVGQDISIRRTATATLVAYAPPASKPPQATLHPLAPIAGKSHGNIADPASTPECRNSTQRLGQRGSQSPHLSPAPPYGLAAVTKTSQGTLPAPLAKVRAAASHQDLTRKAPVVVKTEREDGNIRVKAEEGEPLLRLDGLVDRKPVRAVSATPANTEAAEEIVAGRKMNERVKGMSYLEMLRFMQDVNPGWHWESLQ